MKLSSWKFSLHLVTESLAMSRVVKIVRQCFKTSQRVRGRRKNTALVVTIQAATIIVIIIVDRARTSRRLAGIPPERLV